MVEIETKMKCKNCPHPISKRKVIFAYNRLRKEVWRHTGQYKLRSCNYGGCHCTDPEPSELEK